ncbi:hypothetical protein [Streptomyces sp. NPDC007100]|uniref:hypothetical protein n=1 Tax=unclassified Streptomyces TaxID=2593676 RepID=UPI0033E11ABA
MPTSIMEEADGLLDAPSPVRDAAPLPEAAPRPARPEAHGAAGAVLQCPSCGSPHVAQVLGDNGGISFVCTACGHSWS